MWELLQPSDWGSAHRLQTTHRTGTNRIQHPQVQKLHIVILLTRLCHVFIMLQYECCCLFFSFQNSTDWCTYSLQRRRANTSTNTIDHRTHYHRVCHAWFLQACNECNIFFQSTHLHVFDLTETPSDSDPKKKKKKRDDDPDRKKKKKDKKKKKVRRFMEAPVNQTVFFYESSCDAERKPSKTLLTQSTLNLFQNFV